ncbi:MAG: DUF6236 family protein, partial [Bacteroidota bacterium]|nr:DUF6236 family protein [Bacteroidota bacterium]
MNRTILYYPTINIPNQSWLRHALLYYDEISSIVPQSWDNNTLINLSDEIHYLIDENQFRAMKPEDLIFRQSNWEVFDEFKNEFMSIVSSAHYKKFINFRRTVIFDGRRNKIEESHQSRIHRNKTSALLYEFLREKELATISDDPEWLLFEENTALLYLSLLAKYLADIDGRDQTTIGTDHQAYEKLNFKKVNDTTSFPVVSLSLDKILPTPKVNVPLEAIIDFKRRRADNLRHFKGILSDFQIKISKTQSQSEFKEACISFKELLTNGVNELNAVISDSRIEAVYKGFKSMISFKSSLPLAA